MLLAFDALEKGNLGRLQQLLAKYDPAISPLITEAPAEDFRGWEWQYLAGRALGDERLALSPHSNIVHSAFLLPGNRTAVSTTRDGIHFWDVEKKSHDSKPYPLGQSRAALHPSGRWLVAPAWKAWTVWDTTTGQLVHIETNSVVGAREAAFSRDGSKLAIAGTGVTIYDFSTRQQIGRPVSRHDPADLAFTIGLAFSPDGKTLAFGHGDDRILLLDIASGAEITLGRAGHWEALALAFSPDGHFLVSGDRQQITIWDSIQRTKVTEIVCSEQVISVAFSPDGKQLATAGGDHKIRLWSTESWTPDAVLQGHSGEIFCVAYSADGRQLISASKDRSIRLWDAKQRAPNRSTKSHWLTIARRTPAGCPLALFQDGAHSVVFLDCTSLAQSEPEPVPAEFATAWTNAPDAGKAFARDSSTAAVALRAGQAQLWRTRPFRKLGRVGHSGINYHTLALSDTGELIAMAQINNEVEIWTVDSRQRIKTIPPVGASLSDGVFGFRCQDQAFIRAVDEPRQRVEVWPLRGGTATRVIEPGHHDFLNYAAISPDGGRLVTSAWDGALKFFELASGRELETVHGQLVGFQVLAFSSDGSRLAAGGWDGSITLWDMLAQPFRQVGHWKAHRRDCDWIRFVDGDRTLLSVGDWQPLGEHWQMTISAATAPALRVQTRAVLPPSKK